MSLDDARGAEQELVPDSVTARAPRIDVITIFPDYVKPLELSLIGKARTSGLVDIRVHDLREFATDRHRTVDDAPFGGGAGMVMRPDVWARAIDATATHQHDDGERDTREMLVLVPTPSGAQLTQERAAELAAMLSQGVVRAVVACGRYEGIDARLVDHLNDSSDVREVSEFSLGDYVLNGGDVAAIALLESVVRLLPGVLGNPESIVEESFQGDGLLEYPVFTRPAQWEERAVPAVLTSGDHQAVARWRREQSLRRTARRRPELLAPLATGLTRDDASVLRSEGVVAGAFGHLAGPFTVRIADLGDVADLAEVAAATFILACPDETTLGDIRAHIATQLNPQVFSDYIQEPGRDLLVVIDGVSGGIVGYSMLIWNPAAQSDAGDLASGAARSAVELSKCYVLARVQGSGAARELMAATLEHARSGGADQVWLGVNAQNDRALAFYARSGFERAGQRSYRVGAVDHSDDVMRFGLTKSVAE